MPLKRYEIRNEYSLADPELYKVADKDDPEAILEGVAMAGLVGVLRQLGDLAEFAAEIFHDLHEDVMSTAARGHGLIARVQQVEAEFPAIERKLLSQTSHTSFLYNSSIDWHSNPRLDENTITQGGLPRFVMDSYEECRGPPRLFLLDKFDVAGAGACLKRFTDPSFFKMGSAGGKLERQREKKNRKVKKRGAHLKNGEPPESFPSSHAKLHQLFLEERIENGGSDHDRRVKLKKRQFTGSLFDHESTKSYMENFLDTCPLEQRIVHEFDPLPLTWTSNNASESSLEIVESGTGSPVKESTQYDQDICSSPDVGDIVVKSSIDESNGGKSNDCVNNEALKVLAVNSSTYVNNIPSSTGEVVNSEDFADRERKKADCFNNGYDSDDVASEIDGYVDALASMESEVDTDSERKKYTSYMNRNPVMVDSDESFERQELQGGYLDSQSVGNSATSENNFRERTNSSRSNSVTAFAENTADFDMVASDNDNKFSGGHLVSKKISDNEAEEHAMAHVSDLKVNGGPKVAGEFDDVSDTSSLTDPNSKVLSTGRETRLIEDYDDVYPNSSGNDVAPGERDQTHAFNGSVPGFVEKANNENLSGEHSIHAVAGHISSVDSDTSPDAQDTSPQIQSYNNGHSACSSFEEQTTDIFETSNSGGSKLSSPGNSEASEIVRSGSFVARIDSSENILRSVVASTLDDGETLDDYLMLGKPSSSQDLLAEGMPQKVKSEENDADGYSFSKGDTVSDGGVAASANILESDTACHDFMPTSPDQTEDVKIKAQLDHSLTDAVVTLAGSDHDCSDQIEDGNKVFSNEAVLLETQNDSANDPTAATAVEDDADLDFNAGKLEPVQAAVACSRSANFMDDTEQLQDRLPSVSEEDNLIRDEPTEDHRAEITDNNDVNSVPDTSVDLNLGLCNTDNNDVNNGVASQDIENNENNIQIVQLPSSEQMDLEEVRDCDDESSKHYLSNEHDISSALDNFGKDTQTPESLQSGEHISSTATAWSQSEPFVSMPPSQSPSFDHQTNLEAPPLPPLPPMQWRLGKFRNFSSSPEMHSAQERVGQAQVQPMPFPGVHHSLGPGLPMNLPAVHYTLAPVQPAVLPVHHTLLPVAQMPMPTLEHPNISIAQTSRNEGHTGSLDGYVVLPGGIAVPIATVGSQGFSQSDNSAVGRKEHLIFSVPSTSGYMPLQGEATMPILATTTGGSSQDNLLFSSPETVTLSQINTSASEGGPEDDDTSALNESIVPKTTEQETMSGSVRFQPMSPVHQPPAGFVATEAERTWLSTYDGAHTHTGNSTNGLLQKKLPRPRNPLIDEVVAIDKSKFRKVERVKPSLDSKSEEVESLLEQMQLRKVEKVKPPMETKVKEGGYKMEHFQLRKVGEHVKPFAEPKHDESEFIPEQLQLRKVGERFKAEVEHKAEETDSPRVQLRKLSERVKPEVVPKTEETESPRIQLRKVGERVKQEIEARIEETESPRVQLRKVGENSQATVAPKVEERDFLLEQIRNKSFSLKPAVAARPNIQGPRTNLKVAAILEKASNIRQAMAGSDEDDDADTWE